MVKTILKYSCLAGAASLMASPAFAQEAPEHSVFILNSLLFLMAGFLVMFMACGFCMLEAGLVRSKKYDNAINQKHFPLLDRCGRLLPTGLQFDVPAGHLVNRRNFFRRDWCGGDGSSWYYGR